MNTTELLPRIAVTLGDPAGVGPELAVRLLARPETTRMAEVYILADAAEVEAAAQAAGVVVPLSAAPRPVGAGRSHPGPAGLPGRGGTYASSAEEGRRPGQCRRS